MRYKCKWSKMVSAITFVVLLVLVVAGYQLYGNGSFIGCGAIFTITMITLSYSPIYIELTQETILIKKSFNAVVIERSEIETVGRISGSLGLRKFGSGGFFGYLGWFWNQNMGNYFSYVTDEKEMILITTRKRQYVISCENSEDLLSKLL